MNKLLLLIALLLAVLLISSAHATESTHNWYLRGDSATVNTVTAYVANETQSSTSQTVTGTITDTSYYTVQWGWRVWHVDNLGGLTELTSGVPSAIVTLNANTSSIQTAYWTAKATRLWVGFDSLKLVIYQQFGSLGWTAKAVFTSNLLMEKNVTADSWLFSMYLIVNRYPSGPDYVTATSFSWGSSSYSSRIDGVTFLDADTFEKQASEGLKGNWIGFIIAPWANLMGGVAFWSLTILVIPCMGIYIRTKSTIPILLVTVLFGADGGIFTFIIGDSGIGAVLWLFMIISLAGLLYKVFK
jgi:hypothetical protein